MSHEMFKLARASEKELDLLVAGGAIGAVIMLALLGFLLWRDRGHPGRKANTPRTRRRKSSRR
jgi:O-antigen ligase